MIKLARIKLHSFTRSSVYYESVATLLASHRGNDEEMNAFIHRENRAIENVELLLLTRFLKGRHNPVSMVRFVPYARYGYVDAVHTLKEHRGKGHMKRLFAKLLELFGQDIKYPIRLVVECGNIAAVGLYESLGFRFLETCEKGEQAMVYRSSK